MCLLQRGAGEGEGGKIEVLLVGGGGGEAFMAFWVVYVDGRNHLRRTTKGSTGWVVARRRAIEMDDHGGAVWDLLRLAGRKKTAIYKKRRS